MHQPEVNSSETRGTLLSIQCAQPQTISDADGEWTTGIFKETVAGEVHVDSTGLEGDGQADLKHHGGRDKAVLVYCADHYPDWSDKLQLDFRNGGFGENLSVTGIDEGAVCIGDQWKIGSAVFEVSQPRQPCWKLGRRWSYARLPKLVAQSGRSGWYVRVIETGSVTAGDEVLLTRRTHADWTIARANDVFYRGTPEQKSALAAVELLAESWKDDLR